MKLLCHLLFYIVLSATVFGMDPSEEDLTPEQKEANTLMLLKKVKPNEVFFAVPFLMSYDKFFEMSQELIDNGKVDDAYEMLKPIEKSDEIAKLSPEQMNRYQDLIAEIATKNYTAKEAELLKCIKDCTECENLEAANEQACRLLDQSMGVLSKSQFDQCLVMKTTLLYKLYLQSKDEKVAAARSKYQDGLLVPIDIQTSEGNLAQKLKEQWSEVRKISAELLGLSTKKIVEIIDGIVAKIIGDILKGENAGVITPENVKTLVKELSNKILEFSNEDIIKKIDELLVDKKTKKGVKQNIETFAKKVAEKMKSSVDELIINELSLKIPDVTAQEISDAIALKSTQRAAKKIREKIVAKNAEIIANNITFVERELVLKAFERTEVVTFIEDQFAKRKKHAWIESTSWNSRFSNWIESQILVSQDPVDTAKLFLKVAEILLKKHNNFDGFFAILLAFKMNDVEKVLESKWEPSDRQWVETWTTDMFAGMRKQLDAEARFVPCLPNTAKIANYSEQIRNDDIKFPQDEIAMATVLSYFKTLEKYRENAKKFGESRLNCHPKHIHFFYNLPVTHEDDLEELSKFHRGQGSKSKAVSECALAQWTWRDVTSYFNKFNVGDDVIQNLLAEGIYTGADLLAINDLRPGPKNEIYRKLGLSEIQIGEIGFGLAEYKRAKMQVRAEPVFHSYDAFLSQLPRANNFKFSDELMSDGIEESFDFSTPRVPQAKTHSRTTSEGKDTFKLRKSSGHNSSKSAFINSSSENSSSSESKGKKILPATQLPILPATPGAELVNSDLIRSSSKNNRRSAIGRSRSSSTSEKGVLKRASKSEKTELRNSPSKAEQGSPSKPERPRGALPDSRRGSDYNVTRSGSAEDLHSVIKKSDN